MKYLAGTKCALLALCALGAAAVVMTVSFGFQGEAVAQNGGGRLSPASLDLDTAGCPTTFGAAVCEKQTEWSLSKSTDEVTMLDPVNEDFSFDVTVTEELTKTVLKGSGTIKVTNSGEVTSSLASIVVLLERETPRGGDAPGPSGRNWQILSQVEQSEYPDADVNCLDGAGTCYGSYASSEGASLVLFDPDSNDVIALTDELLIAPTQDNDGDGRRDEDPVDGIDNDGDGLIDEDDACTDAVIINFEYEFVIDDLGIDPVNDTLRVDLLTTFASGGNRGATCSVDIDGDCIPDNWVRTVQQRGMIDIPACIEKCQEVELFDGGPTAGDGSCVAVSTNIYNFSQSFNATGTPTTYASGVDFAAIGGSVTCVGEGCSETVTNTATLQCTDGSDLVFNSPDSAGFLVMCSPGPEDPPIEPGDFCTQTQGGWGSVANGNNPGAFRDTWFPIGFPNGLIVGDPDGPDADPLYAIWLQTSLAVQKYLPAGGTPAALTADQTNPLVTSSGVFGGQIVAATLSVGFDDAGLRNQTYPPGTLGELVFVDGVHPDLLGMSVNEVLALANIALSGGGVPGELSISDLSDALATFNENFVDCDTNNGDLALPQDSGQ